MSKALPFLALLALSQPVWADDAHQHAAAADAQHAVSTMPSLEVTMHNAEKESLGTITLTDAPQGVLVAAELQNIAQGWHGFHIHAKGDCSAEGFTSAGGHADHHHHGKEVHGFLTQAGPHTGDMPNIWAGSDGISKVNIFLPDQHFADFLDEDGAAIILHQQADDYRSQPSGAAGPRIGCAVLKP